jgi:hypothetical protein
VESAVLFAPYASMPTARGGQQQSVIAEVVFGRLARQSPSSSSFQVPPGVEISNFRVQDATAKLAPALWIFTLYPCKYVGSKRYIRINP